MKTVKINGQTLKIPEAGEPGYDQFQEAVKPTSKPKVEQFRGHPVLNLDPSGRPFSFGVSKAKLILEHFDAIKTFVEQHGTNGAD